MRLAGTHRDGIAPLTTVVQPSVIRERPVGSAKPQDSLPQTNVLAFLHAAHKERLARLNPVPVGTLAQAPLCIPSEPLAVATYEETKVEMPSAESLTKRDWIIPEPHVPTVAEIIKAVCFDFKMRKVDLISLRRTKDVMLPRHIATWMARRYTLLSLPQIGRAMGGKDHTTILNSWRKIERLRARDTDLQARLDKICKMVGIVES
jgi:chromosomal replication initiator protein